MAIVGRGFTTCAICNVVVEEDDEIVATSHFASGPFDPFHPYSDAPFHRRCFDGWPRRREFIFHYNALAVGKRGPDGLVFRMGEDGAITRLPASSVTSVALPNVGLKLDVSRRRPGMFLVVNHHRHDLMPARLIVALPRGQADIAKEMRVWPIARVMASQATDEFAAPVRELNGMPVGFERSEGCPDPAARFFEAGDEAGEMAMRFGTHFLIQFPADHAPLEISCWAYLG